MDIDRITMQLTNEDDKEILKKKWEQTTHCEERLEKTFFFPLFLLRPSHVTSMTQFYKLALI